MSFNWSAAAVFLIAVALSGLISCALIFLVNRLSKWFDARTATFVVLIALVLVAAICVGFATA